LDGTPIQQINGYYPAPDATLFLDPQPLMARAQSHRAFLDPPELPFSLKNLGNHPEAGLEFPFPAGSTRQK